MGRSSSDVEHRHSATRLPNEKQFTGGAVYLSQSENDAGLETYGRVNYFGTKFQQFQPLNYACFLGNLQKDKKPANL